MKRTITAMMLAAAAFYALPAAAQTTMRLLSQSPPQSKQLPLELAAIERLHKNPDAGMTVARSEFAALGLNTGDALRYIRGTFDAVSVPIGIASRDDPFLEGIDIMRRRL